MTKPIILDFKSAALLRALLRVSWKTRFGAQTLQNPLTFNIILLHVTLGGLGSLDTPCCSLWVFRGREKLALGCPANTGPKGKMESSLLKSAHPIVPLAARGPAASSCICPPSQVHMVSTKHILSSQQIDPSFCEDNRFLIQERMEN